MGSEGKLLLHYHSRYYVNPCVRVMATYICNDRSHYRADSTSSWMEGIIIGKYMHLIREENTCTHDIRYCSCVYLFVKSLLKCTERFDFTWEHTCRHSEQAASILNKTNFGPTVTAVCATAALLCKMCCPILYNYVED